MSKERLLALFFLGFYLPIFGQTGFTCLSGYDGLSQSTVLSICQDSRGYMWFGTRNHLNRYDSRNFRIYEYKQGDSTSISSDTYIFSMLEDREKNLWIGTESGLNRYRPEQDNFERIYAKPQDKNSLHDNNILCIYEDRLGGLWFGTKNGLSYLSNPSSRSFVSLHKGKDGHGLAGNEIYALYEDRAGSLWVGTTEGLTRMTRKGSGFSFTSFTHDVPLGISGNSIKAICEDRFGNLWVGTENEGLNLYDASKDYFVHFMEGSAKGQLVHNSIRKIVSDKNGNLWVGTKEGLCLLDPSTKSFQVFQSDQDNPYSLSDNSIKEIYFDKEGGLWIGTMYGGVNMATPGTFQFHIFGHSKLSNSISSDLISAITADSKSNLWIGTEGKGLNYYDTKKKLFASFSHRPGDPSSLGSNFVKALLEDSEGKLWIGLHQGGLDFFDPLTGTFRHYKHGSFTQDQANRDNVYCLLEDSKGNLWVGTAQGLELFDRATARFKTLGEANISGNVSPGITVRCLFEDSHNNLWIGTALGIYVLSLVDTSNPRILASPPALGHLRTAYVNSIWEDRNGRIWIAAYNSGLSCYYPGSNKLQNFTIADGLISNNVIDIKEDFSGNLWLSTDKGLMCFNTDHRQIRSFDIHDGLPANEFNHSSSFRLGDGTLFFGSYGGLVSFSPEEMQFNERTPRMVFTELKLFNKIVGAGDGTGLLARDISLTDTVIFSHDQNVFTVGFAALSFIKTAKNRYQYKLDGFEVGWNDTKIPLATYTNLAPGHYTLLVKGSNNDGVWNEVPSRLHIIVRPPVWATAWAFVLYAIVATFLFVVVIRFFKRQTRLERDLYHEHLSSEKEKQMYQMKLDFFTKISHEIRTPLTLILAPLEQLLETHAGDKTLGKQLGYMRQNGHRLLRLIGELLDFRKIESGSISLQLHRSDLVRFCRSVFRSFQSMALSRNIKFEFEHTQGTLMVSFDAAQLEKVFFNILANAFKFTPDGGTIKFTVDSNDGDAVVRISDTGCGITPEKIDQVFSEFYSWRNATNASEGWGIGLALAKRITELHSGTISVKSTVAQNGNPGRTVFSIRLPRIEELFEDDVLLDESIAEPLIPLVDVMKEDNRVSLPAMPSQATLLLVEDNEQVREFLVASLSNHWNIIEAKDGLEGWECVLAEMPDLLIMDVSMPNMDGLVLCQHLKADLRTCHIPIVMLTARTSHNHQIEGLESGADVYVTKPFSVHLLGLTIRNQLNHREALRQKFSKNVFLQPQNVLLESADERFLDKLMKIVEQHMDDAEFGAAVLTGHIAMSHTVLNGKLKALLGMTTADFIKSTRLKHAAQLLSQRQLSVAEVAYSVGFNDRKYFSREFRKQFGKSPSEYVNPATG